MLKKIWTINPLDETTAIVMITEPSVDQGTIEFYNCQIELLIQAGLLTSTGGKKSDLLKQVYDIEVGKSKLGTDIITSIRPKN